jgi:hypothetical protein
MAIINRPATEVKVDPPEEVSGIISRPRVKVEENNFVEDSELGPAPKQGSSFIQWFKWVLLVLAVVGIIVVVRPLLPSINSEKVAAEDIALDVDRLIRIDSVVALLEKRIEHNLGTLEKLEKKGDKVLIGTIRLALAENLIDLEEHQDSYIQVLESLQRAYKANSNSVVSKLKEHLKSSTDSYKLGRVGAINEAMELIASVPENQSPLEYFSKKVKKQK